MISGHCEGSGGRTTTTTPNSEETTVPVNAVFSLVLTNNEDIDPNILTSQSAVFFPSTTSTLLMFTDQMQHDDFHFHEQQNRMNSAWTSRDTVSLRGNCLKDHWLDIAGTTVHEIINVAEYPWKICSWLIYQRLCLFYSS